MKHLIIPTDFSLRSLEPVRAAVTHYAGEPLTITLLHLLEPPLDISEGLRLAYREDNRPSAPPAFSLAVESVAAVHAGQIQGIRVRTCYGCTAPAVRNLLEKFNADAVVFNPDLPFEQPSRKSIDPRPVLRRAAPKHIVELAVPSRTEYASPRMDHRPARNSAPTRLQPASHDNAETRTNTSNFPRHAS